MIPVVLGGRGSQRMIDSIGLSLPGLLCGHGSQRMIDSITLSPPGILCGRGSQRMIDYSLIFTRNTVWAWQSEDD